MDENLRLLSLSLRHAGRIADAENVERTIELATETGEWIACLRCSLGFETVAAKSAHYIKEHRW